MKLPAVVEKDGVRYTCDIVDDGQGADLVITRQEGTGNREKEMNVLLLVVALAAPVGDTEDGTS